MSKTVCISGYFDPLHKGHIEYMKNAKKLGDRLLVIVNNDKQSILKKGQSFMKEEDRLLLVSELEVVDQAVLSIDENRDVCETLRLYKPDIFANGGDQFNDIIPEKPICQELGIELIDGLGDKIESSRHLVRRASTSDFKPEWIGDKYEKTERLWGYYERILPSLSGYQIKRLCIYPGKSISVQKHQFRNESWTIVKGKGVVRVNENITDVKFGDVVNIPLGAVHQIRNESKKNLILIEVQTGSYLGEDDITRYS